MRPELLNRVNAIKFAWQSCASIAVGSLRACLSKDGSCTPSIKGHITVKVPVEQSFHSTMVNEGLFIPNFTG